MSKEDDGGPAFPSDNDRYCSMSMRDYFAASALHGLLACPQGPAKEADETWDQYYARRAYEYADAMLEARKK